MKVLVYSYATGDQKTIAEIELKNGKLVFSGPSAEGLRDDMKRGLMNIVENKPDERIHPDNPELFLKNLPYWFSGSLTKAELFLD